MRAPVERAYRATACGVKWLPGRETRAAPSDALLRSGSLRLAVLQHLNLFQRDEAARDHAVEHRQEGVDLLLRVDDLDHDRQVLRQAQDFGGVDVARMAEAHRTAQDRGASELHLAGFDQNRLIERQAPRLGVFPDEDSEQDGVTRKLHGLHPSHRIEAEGGDMAEPNGQQAHYHRTDNIEGGLHPFAVAHEIKRLQTERGKRRVPAAEADHHELPRRSADKDAPVGTGQRGEESDDEGTDDVDDQRAPRKRLADQSCRYARAPVAGDAADGTSNRNLEIESHDLARCLL